MAVNPSTVRKILKELLKNAPVIIEAIKKISKKLKSLRKAAPESEPLSEETFSTNQEVEEKFDVFRNSLKQHVKMINKHSKVLTEHEKIIEEITIQSENLAIQSKNLATLVNVLIWIAGISFAVSVTAVLVAILK